MPFQQQNCGTRLKEFRLKSGLKLKDLAACTGLSISFLSKIENGAGNPSAENIQKLCYVLGITPNDLFTQKTPEERLSSVYHNRSYILRNNERCLLYDFSGIIRLESIFEGDPHYKLNVMTLSGNMSEHYSAIHSYDELGVVASGSMIVTFDDDSEHLLNPGDAIMIRANQHHTVVCVSGQDCISYWIEMNALD